MLYKGTNGQTGQPKDLSRFKITTKTHAKEDRKRSNNPNEPKKTGRLISQGKYRKRILAASGFFPAGNDERTEKHISLIRACQPNSQVFENNRTGYTVGPVAKA